MSSPPPEKKPPRFTTKVILMGILLALLANLVLIALVSPKPLPEQEQVIKAMTLLRESHVSRPSQAQLAEGALAGMANQLHDPYTQFLPEEKAAVWESTLSAETELRTLSGRPGAWLMDGQKGIGYAALSRFTSHTGKGLREAIAGMKAGNLRGLILDLRGNPGGYLLQAKDVASLFLPRGTPVATVRGPSMVDRAFATDAAPLTDAPLVILIDENSASASEVLAGALMEHKRAFVVGSRSFGKGCVQSVVKLEELHGELKVTTGYYFLPSGRCIHRDGKNDWGVAPSTGGQVLMTATQRKLWAATRKLPPAENPLTAEAPVSADFLRNQLNDAPLAAAYEALIGKLGSGAWPRVGDDPTPATQDPRWHAREEIRLLENKLKNLRLELATPSAAPASN